MIKKADYIFLFIVFALAFCMLSPSCANTSTPPSGGPKDTLPPIMVNTVPLMESTMHPTLPKKSNVSFEFNEYVVLKDPITNIYLSPPLNKRPAAKIKGRSVVVSFEDTLAANTTYTLDLGQGVADNNEGNLLPKFVFCFSTGNEVDSIYSSGTVVDAKTMLPLSKITVLFHSDPSDSAVFNLLPAAAAKTDTWGYFSLRNIKPGPYHVYAIDDKNNNNKYDPEEETIAFLDSVYVADKIMRDSLPALNSYDVKDTANCLARPSDMQLYLFKEVSSRQLLRNKGRLGKRMAYITFSAPYAVVDSLAISGYSPDKIITQFNVTKDSLAIWINDPKPVPDTIILSVKYLKTDDSLKILTSVVEDLKLAAPKKKYTKDRKGDNVEVIDTVASYQLLVQPETVEQEGYVLEFEYPLSIAPFDSLQFSYVTPKQQIKQEGFTVTQDSTNIRRYTIMPDNPLVLGNEYILKVPHRIFYDINGLPCDSLVKKLTLPKDDKLSSLTLEMSDVNGNYIVELISEKRDKVYRTYRINGDKNLLFPYLKPAKYSIRITEDKNSNGLIDTGSLLEKRQPEKVLLYKMGVGTSNEAYLMDIPERVELTQSINITEMFK